MYVHLHASQVASAAEQLAEVLIFPAGDQRPSLLVNRLRVDACELVTEWLSEWVCGFGM